MSICFCSVRQLHHAAHHFLVALVLASVVLILEYHGMLNWLDTVSLRAVGSIHADERAASSFDPQDAPIPLLIGDEYFETAFRQESPLDRRELARLIGRILHERPAVLAIDLDLSPGPNGSPGNAGQDELDTLLIRYSKDEKVPIVLTTPFPVVANALFAAKHAWLAKLCAGGIRLGYPQIVLSQGLVMRYTYRQPSLGLVASGVGPEAKTAPHGDGDLCADVLAGPDKAVFLSKAFQPESIFGADDLRGQRPINPDYLRKGGTLQRVIRGDNIDAALSGLGNRPVFLGSQFDSRDEFLTPYGPQKGVVIHAATFYSERRPTNTVTHGIAVLLDLAFGVAAGFLFGAVWQRTNAASAMHGTEVLSFQHWLAARIWLAAAFGLLVLWLVMLFYASAWLLTHDLWNNPGPMVVGVFVKTLLASRVGLRDDEHRAKPTVGGAKAALMRNADWLLLSPFVIWAGILLFGH